MIDPTLLADLAAAPCGSRALDERIAAAIAADKTHLLPRRDAEIDFLEQQIRSIAFFEISDRQNTHSG